MKFRNDFVTNSSSSSFVCEICGYSTGGWDMSLSEADMMECVNGHIFCSEHALERPDKKPTPQQKLREAGERLMYGNTEK